MSGGSFCGGREDIYLFGTMITGILLIGLGFALGLPWVCPGLRPDGCLPELDMFPLLQVMCLWYMCFCAEVFFFCSHTVLPMEHSLGKKKIFSSSLSSCKCCIFLTYPVFLFCLPRCHMYVVYVWTGGWLISLVLVTSDNKGLLLLLQYLHVFKQHIFKLAKFIKHYIQEYKERQLVTDS